MNRQEVIKRSQSYKLIILDKDRWKIPFTMCSFLMN
jgi:hypothetical protein